MNMGVIEMVVGIHRSFQTEMVDPEPTCLISPVSSATLPATMVRQVADAVLGTVASWNSVSRKYRPFENSGAEGIGVHHEMLAMLPTMNLSLLIWYSILMNVT